MNEACRAFRDDWLERREGDATHGDCAECQAWTRSTAAQIRLLAGLSALAAPSRLEASLAAELAGDRLARNVRALALLSSVSAPAALEREVFEKARLGERGDAERGERRAQILRTLDLRSAPSVLDRLVDEELRSPATHRADRFSRLERLSAPAVLERRVGMILRRSTLRRFFVGPVATLAAAGLVVWLAVRSGQEETGRREYSFRVVHAAGLEGLDPLGRQLGDVLSAGVSSAVPIAANPIGGDGGER